MISSTVWLPVKRGWFGRGTPSRISLVGLSSNFANISSNSLPIQTSPVDAGNDVRSLDRPTQCIQAHGIVCSWQFLPSCSRTFDVGIEPSWRSLSAYFASTRTLHYQSDSFFFSRFCPSGFIFLLQFNRFSKAVDAFQGNLPKRLEYSR